MIADSYIRAVWRKAGGDFHEPNVEHGSMREDLLLAFLRELIGMIPQWQPIDTAPKDKCIMLCVAGWEPCSGRWWPLDSCWVSFDWEGHFESDQEMSDYVNGTSYEPTHWMPLPAAAPKVEA